MFRPGFSVMRAMKNGLILETMMISRTERKPAFSIRTEFSVSTAGIAPRITALHLLFSWLHTPHARTRKCPVVD
jgi:hypothetical protein